MKHEIIQEDFEQIAMLHLPWEALKGTRIFITGATGFIGSYLARAFCWLNHQMDLGLTVLLIHRKGTVPAFFDESVQWLEGALTKDFLPEWMVPDIIIHAASPANQRAIASDPAGIVECNVLATDYLLKSAHRYNARILFFSSGEVYQRQSGRIAEKAAEVLAESGICSFYGSSKLSGEVLCERYRKKYNVDSRVIRLFSIFGPGEPLTSGRCFTDFMQQALDNHRIRVNGPGTQVRSYCYLSDFVSGLLYILLKGESTVYNIGNESNVCTILELAKKIAAVNGNTEVLGPFSTGTQIDHFVPDTQKLRELEWQPKVDMQACIRRCLNSYRQRK